MSSQIGGPPHIWRRRQTISDADRETRLERSAFKNYFAILPIERVPRWQALVCGVCQLVPMCTSTRCL